MATDSVNLAGLSMAERTRFSATGHLDTAEKLISDVRKAIQDIENDDNSERAEDILEFMRELKLDIREITIQPKALKKHAKIAKRLSQNRAMLAVMQNVGDELRSREDVLREALRVDTPRVVPVEAPHYSAETAREMVTIKSRMTKLEVYSCKGFSEESARNKLIRQKLQDGECDICVLSLDKPVALPCGHVFCADCALSWLLEGATPTCPSCRSDTQVQDPLLQLIRTNECHHGETDALWYSMRGVASLSDDHKEICWRPTNPCRDEAFSHPLDDDWLLSRFTVRAKVVRETGQGSREGTLTANYKTKELVFRSKDEQAALFIPTKSIDAFSDDPENSNGSTLQVDVGLARLRFRFISEAAELEHAVIAACLNYCKSQK